MTSSNQKEILDNIAEGVVVIDNDNTVLYANKSAKDLLNNTKSLVGRKFGYTISLNGFTELTIIKEKQEILLELTSNKINWDNKNCILVKINDVTETKLFEKEYLKKSEIFQSFHDFSPLCLQSLNIEGKIIDVNPTWLSTLGYKRNEVIGKEFKSFLTADSQEEFNQIFLEYKKRGFIKNIHYKLLRKNGEKINIELDGAIGYNNNGEIEKTYCVFKDITKLKSTEEDLQRNLLKLNEAEEASNSGHWELNLMNNEFLWSENIYNLFEIEKENYESLMFSDFLEMVHPDDRILVQEEYQNSIKANQTKTIEHRIVTGKKNVKIVQEKFKTDYDSKGRPVRSYGMLMDITQQRDAHERLIESEELYRELFESESDAIFLVDNKTGEILEANKAATEMYGYSHLELTKMKNIDLSAEPDQTRKITEESPIIKDNVVFIPLRYHKNKNGEQIAVEITGRFFKWKNKDVHIAAVRDISLRIKTDEALRESQRTLSVLMSNLPGMAYRCLNDKDYSMMFVSEGCENLTGYKSKELTYNTVISYNELIHEDYRKKIWDNIQEAVKEQKPFELEYKITTKLGEEKWVWEKGVGVYTNDNRLVALEGFISDISDLKKTQHDLITAKEEAERSNKLKSSFLANMSHEIRTPMNGIVGFSKLLLREDLTDETRQKYVNIINNGSEQLLNIIGDILDISSIETGNVDLYCSEFSIYDLLNTVFDSYVLQSKNQNVKFFKNIRIPEAKRVIYSDQTKLQQVLVNLINNALKFTNKGQIEVECYFVEKYFKISVKDTGLGIRKEKLEAIFDRFNKGDTDLTYKYGGTGLGLSISRAYIEMMGGKINVKSEPGKGSIFYFTIPYSEKEKSNDFKFIEPNAEEKVSLAKCSDCFSVLVAEDEDLNFEYLKKVLSDLNINQIRRAKDGKQVVELINNNIFDLILMDLKMPNLDGFDAISYIRETNKKVPIIAQSALVTSQDKDKAMQCGCNHYITKPINYADLVGLIRNYIK